MIGGTLPQSRGRGTLAPERRLLEAGLDVRGIARRERAALPVPDVLVADQLGVHGRGDRVPDSEGNRLRPREECPAVDELGCARRVGQRRAVIRHGVEPEAEAVGGPGGGHGPARFAADVRLLERRVVQGGPAARLREKLLRLRAARGPHVHRPPEPRAQVQPVISLLPGARVAPVKLGRVDDRRPQGLAPRDQHAARGEEPPARVHDGSHARAQQGEHAVDLRDDDVDPLGKRDLGGPPLDELDAVGAAVGGGDLARHLDDGVRLDRVHAAGPVRARQERPDTGSRADVQHHRALCDGAAERLRVGARPDRVGDHAPVVVDVVHGGGHVDAARSGGLHPRRARPRICRASAPRSAGTRVAARPSSARDSRQRP